jgi:hypothetical protein
MPVHAVAVAEAAAIIAFHGETTSTADNRPVSMVLYVTTAARVKVVFSRGRHRVRVGRRLQQ